MCSTSNLSDECVAEKFRREYSEQFHILVRMHLSFVLDLNTDENECFNEKGKNKKWNLVPFGKKSKLKAVSEGVPLTQEGVCQIYQLIEFLNKEQNLKTEGIFRKTGSVERQQELRNFLSQGLTLDLNQLTYSVHDCASVLKGFIAELPDPLLTEAHFPAYCQIAESCGIIQKLTQDEKLLDAIQLLFLLLPNEHKTLLKDILDLLHRTASFESFNKMSPDNLAKLFTPHLLCPRKLSPENLLKDSQNLFGIVSFMIMKYSELFKIPQKLILEFRARYEKKNILSPTRRSNESVTDAASTVFTFVDHEQTAKENAANPTETALAQLYAHIQSLPESSKKRKLVKQFNKENGHGTPLQVIRSGLPKNKSLGDSIKKHIFQKGLAKKKGFSLLRSTSDEILSNPSNSPSLVTRTRLFCTNCDFSSDLSTEESQLKKFKKSVSCSEDNMDCDKVHVNTKRSYSEPDLSVPEVSVDSNRRNIYLTSTPACLPLRVCPDIVFTPDDQGKKSMSPITRSTQRMTRAMQETMMTPRSRKPVLLVSGTNINTFNKSEQKLKNTISHVLKETPNKEPVFFTEGFAEETAVLKNVLKKSSSDGDIISESKIGEVPKFNSSDPSTSVSDTFKEYLSKREIVTFSLPEDSSFMSRTDDFNSTDFDDSKLTESLLYCLDGNKPDDVVMADEKEPVLKPRQFDENGKAIVFETSF